MTKKIVQILSDDEDNKVLSEKIFLDKHSSSSKAYLKEDVKGKRFSVKK